MKKLNDIDNLFESKINNKTFELKDSYLADFESKLDLYNKKGKGFIWFFLGTLFTLTILFDFILLPNYNVTSDKNKISSNKLETKKRKTNHLKETSIFTNKNLKQSEKETLSTEIKNKEIKKNINQFKSIDKKTIQKSNEENVSSLVKKEPSHPNSIEINKKSNLNDSIDNIQKSIPSIEKTTTQKLNKPKENHIINPKVFIDDTIRRKVIIIDTVIQRDTIIVNDTIKNKIRLFKKKR